MQSSTNDRAIWEARVTTELHHDRRGDVRHPERDATSTSAAILRGGGFCVEVDGLSRTRPGSRPRRDHAPATPCRCAVAPGELLGIVGRSGAGKTTLLEAIAGVAAPTSGSVRFDGVDLYANLRTFRSVIGYVPQDDIIHVDLPLEHTLRYAAWLRLPSSTTAAETRRRGSRRDRRRRPHRACCGPGRLPERRAAQARQHCCRAPH